MIIISKSDIDKCYTMDDCIDSVIESYALSSSDKVKSPIRSKLNIEKVSGTALFMPGLIEEKECLGAKIVSVFPENVNKGKEVINATIIMLEAQTGEIKALIDGTYVTKMRTAAATGASIRLLAKKHVEIGVLFGTGGQADKQLEAMLATRKFSEIRIVGRNINKTKTFTSRMQEEIPQMNINNNHKQVKLIAYENSNEAVVGADIIVLATTTEKPLFDGKLLKKGVHISGIGSYTKAMCEMDEQTVISADKIYIDQVDAILEEAGDFTQLIDKGIIDENFYTGELGELILGEVVGRETDDEITIFKSVGISAQDLVVADHITLRAISEGIGQKIEI